MLVLVWVPASPAEITKHDEVRGSPMPIACDAPYEPIGVLAGWGEQDSLDSVKRDLLGLGVDARIEYTVRRYASNAGFVSAAAFIAVMVPTVEVAKALPTFAPLGCLCGPVEEPKIDAQ